MNPTNTSSRAAGVLKFLMAASFVPLLMACAPEFDPPPDYQGGFLWNSDKSRTITVEPGDSLYAISQRYDVPIRVIIARNALQPPYALTSGQDLVLDPVRTHRVMAGETLDGIARQSGVDVALIAEANDLHQPYSVHPDQDLWIPDPFTVAAATAVPASSGATDLTRPVQVASAAQSTDAAPARGPVIAVETLAPPPGTPVAPDFGPTAQPNSPPTAVAQISPPSTAPESTTIAPPSPPTAPPPATPQTPPPQVPATPQTPSPPLHEVTPQTPPTQVSPSPQTPSPASPQTPVPPPPVAAPEAAATSAPPPTQLAAIPPAATTEPVAPPATRFIWPVRGRLISGFGPAGKGLHNDGINIAAPLGTQVRAVDNGVVAYAGNELKGFGNLLLIKHADGLTTAYAHNDKLLVAKGDTVRKGQVVATVGKTGGVDSPQLHFEVRVGTQAVDPEEYLQQVASH